MPQPPSFNFSFHGRSFRFATISLGFLDTRNRFRRALAWLVTSRQFEAFILLCIVANSIFLGMADFSHVDANTYDLRTDGSDINTFLWTAELAFIAIFTVELVCKVRHVQRNAASRRVVLTTPPRPLPPPRR